MDSAVFKVRSFKRGADRRKSAVQVGDDRRTRTEDRRSPWLGWVALFKNTDEAAVIEAVADCEILCLPPGAPLLKPFEANDKVYLLLSGQLAVHLDNAAKPGAAILIEHGECIGEMSAIDGKPASALVLAATEAHVLKLPQDIFWNRLMAIPGVARNLLVVLSERMRRNNQITLEAQRKQIELEYLQQELDVARQLQAGMLPGRGSLFPERRDIEVAGVMEPASSVGGDLFDAFFIDERNLFFCIGDVSGHGIPAALFMARAIGLMRIAAMKTDRPERLLEDINEQLCNGNDTSMFVTLFCGFLDVESGQLTYSNAGHCAPLLLLGNEASRLPLPKGALAGAMPGRRYTAFDMSLPEGATLLCYTDGITEAQTGTGAEFSEDRLLETVRQNTDPFAHSLLDNIYGEVARFTGDLPPADDCTLLAVRRLRAD